LLNGDCVFYVSVYVLGTPHTNAIGEIRARLRRNYL